MDDPGGTAGPLEGVMSPGLRALTVGLVLTVTLVAFEALAVATALPAAERDLGDVQLYGWVFSAFLLASLIGIAFAGDRSDIGGPAFPYIAGLVLFGTGLVVGGLAPSMGVLVAGRAVQGLGAGRSRRSPTLSSAVLIQSGSARGCSRSTPRPGSCRGW